MSNQPILPGQAFTTVPKISDEVLKLITDQLNNERPTLPETVNKLTYQLVVDKLPAGCISEDVAEAAEALYRELRYANGKPISDDPACGLVNDFINHINHHIANQPVGGYDAEQSRVAITVGGKTFEFYDHAALMQSLLDGLEYLKTEL